MDLCLAKSLKINIVIYLFHCVALVEICLVLLSHPSYLLLFPNWQPHWNRIQLCIHLSLTFFVIFLDLLSLYPLHCLSSLSLLSLHLFFRLSMITSHLHICIAFWNSYHVLNTVYDTCSVCRIIFQNICLLKSIHIIAPLMDLAKEVNINYYWIPSYMRNTW